MPLSQAFSELEYKYTPARLKHYKSDGYVIVFDCMNPDTGKLHRVKRKVNELRKLYRDWWEFKSKCTEMMLGYNRILARGWTPWSGDHFADARKMVLEEDHFREATKMVAPADEEPVCSGSSLPEHPEVSPLMEREVMTVTECLTRWLNYKNNLRPDTLRSYRSISNLLTKWIDESFPNIRMREFTRRHAVIFMEYIDNGDLAARTYNNYLGNARAFFSWACSAEFCDYNPFDKIDDKPVEDKFRDVIPLDHLTKIRNYFEETRPEFVTVMLLIYFGGMRPKEITRVKVNQIKLSKQGIEMPGYQTKTHAARVSPLSKELVLRLADAIKCAQPTDYLIGRKWVPGPEPISTKAFQKRWDKMRKELKMPDEYQVYSLRDCSAFYRMENPEIAPLDAMKGLGHKRIYQTLEYANHDSQDLAKRLEEGTPKF